MSLSCKIHRTILKTVKGRTQTNGPKVKEINDYAQTLTQTDGIDRPYVTRKEGERRLASIENCIHATVQRNRQKRTKKN